MDGTSVDETYTDEIAVTVVATSFDVPDDPDVPSMYQQAPPAETQQYGNFAVRAPAPAPPADNRPRKFWSRF